MVLSRRMPSRRAFSLVELLVVLGLVALLVGLTLPLWNRSRQLADRATALSQMRQIGLALFQSVADRDGILPGPMKSGQGAVYSSSATDRLATALGPYLGVDDPMSDQVLDTFLPPAFVRRLGSAAASANPFVMNISARDPSGQSLKPWGSTASPVAPPMRLAAVSPAVWALCDADQLNPLVIGQPWASRTPHDIVHGSERLALYFDGRVAAISQGHLRPSGGGGGSPPKPPPPPPPR